MTENLTALERQVKLMSNIVKRLRIKAGHYRSEVYPNPCKSVLPRYDFANNGWLALAYHYAQLQSLAFEEDFDLAQSIDEIDKTYPKYFGIHKSAGDFMGEWNRAIEEDDRTVEAMKGGTKRSAAVDVSRLAIRNIELIAVLGG